MEIDNIIECLEKAYKAVSNLDNNVSINGFKDLMSAKVEIWKVLYLLDRERIDNESKTN